MTRPFVILASILFEPILIFLRLLVKPLSIHIQSQKEDAIQQGVLVTVWSAFAVVLFLSSADSGNELYSLIGSYSSSFVIYDIITIFRVATIIFAHATLPLLLGRLIFGSVVNFQHATALMLLTGFLTGIPALIISLTLWDLSLTAVGETRRYVDYYNILYNWIIGGG